MRPSFFVINLQGHTVVCSYKANEGGGVRLRFFDNHIARYPSSGSQEKLNGRMAMRPCENISRLR